MAIFETFGATARRRRTGGGPMTPASAVPPQSVKGASGDAGTDAARPRVAWVDVAKGLCIVLVVMMHSTLGVGEAFGREGWLHAFVAFAQPFRMPDFFLIAGLFAAGLMTRPLAEFADRKILHFLYFLVLWTAIQLLLKEGGTILRDPLEGARLLGLALVEPYGTMWFVALLPVLFVVTRLAWGLPAPLVLAAGAGLEIAHLSSEWTLLHEFPRRFVYFYAGAKLAPLVFAFAARVASAPGGLVAGALGLWALGNGAVVAAGLGQAPVVSLLAGTAGALAVVAVAVRLAPTRAGDAFRMLGSRSLAIYLAFFLPMAATRIALARSAVVADVGLASAVVTVVAVLVPVALAWLVRGTALRFLFERPAWARLGTVKESSRSPRAASS